MTVADLYHEQVPYLINYYQLPDNYNTNGGTEPVPTSAVINEAQNVKFNLVPGKKYLFPIINVGAFAAFWIQFDQHQLSVVEVDGVYTVPYTVDQLYMTAAQRYAVIIEAKADSSQNFAVMARMNTDMFNPQTIPEGFNTDVSITAHVVL